MSIYEDEKVRWLRVCQQSRSLKRNPYADIILSNINVLGLALIIALACTFAIVDLVLLKFLFYVPWFRRRLSPRIDRWIQDGVLQFQRRAYEAHKRGTWEDLDQPIPTTAHMEKLPELPLVSRPLSVVIDLNPLQKPSMEQISDVSSPNISQQVPTELHVAHDNDAPIDRRQEVQARLPESA